MPVIPSARQTFINDGTTIDVSSSGDGGTVVVWSDQQTTFLGSIDGWGGNKGGSVELSSAGDLRQAKLVDVALGGGQLLLDPKNIIIANDDADQSWRYQAILGVAHGISNSQLQASDQLGDSVALNGDGSRLAVGADRDNGADNTVANAGAVYLFTPLDYTSLANSHSYALFPSERLRVRVADVIAQLIAGTHVILGIDNLI